MGDPLQTGRELNRIHRPKFPTVLFGITVILTLVGIVMQGILLSHMEMVGAENYPVSYTHLTLPTNREV